MVPQSVGVENQRKVMLLLRLLVMDITQLQVQICRPVYSMTLLLDLLNVRKALGQPQATH